MKCHPLPTRSGGVSLFFLSAIRVFLFLAPPGRWMWIGWDERAGTEGVVVAIIHTQKAVVLGRKERRCRHSFTEDDDGGGGRD